MLLNDMKKSILSYEEFFESIDIKLDNNSDNNDVNINGHNIKLNDKSKKYKNKLEQSIENMLDSQNQYELDRMTGGIDKLKEKVKAVLDKINGENNSKNNGGENSENNSGKKIELHHITDNIKETFHEIINNMEYGQCKYVAVDELFNKYKNEFFAISEQGVGKGEVLLSLFADVARHTPQISRGDNYINKLDEINIDEKSRKTEIEVKSAGAVMKVCNSNYNNIKSVCAYSIAKYLVSRNIGENLYLVIFDNDINLNKLSSDVEKNIQMR